MDQAKTNEIQDPAEVDRIIAAELESLLDSPMFTRSPVLSRLLQFLVEHRLRGGRSSPSVPIPHVILNNPRNPDMSAS